MIVLGQTFYYKQIKVVCAEDCIVKGNNSGQFITFTKYGCYDSDKKGFDIGNGFLKLLKKTSVMNIYYGTSYWGNAFYYVNLDFSRINIKIEDSGKILVYTRAKPNARILTSFYVKKKNKEETTVIPQNPYLNMNIDIVRKHNNTSGKSRKKVRELCSFCKGTGLSPYDLFYAPRYNGKSTTLKYCSICGKYDESHSHKRCLSCEGKGYLIKYK